jgi:hypothetical protein
MLNKGEPRQTEQTYRFKEAGLTGGANCTATDCVSCAGGTAALVWIVKGWVQVETTPSVSVTVAEADPVTGPVEAATPVTAAVTPSKFRTTVAEGSEKVYATFESAPPEGVTPSASKGTMEAVEV